MYIDRRLQRRGEDVPFIRASLSRCQDDAVVTCSGEKSSGFEAANPVIYVLCAWFDVHMLLLAACSAELYHGCTPHLQSPTASMQVLWDSWTSCLIGKHQISDMPRPTTLSFDKAGPLPKNRENPNAQSLAVIHDGILNTRKIWAACVAASRTCDLPNPHASSQCVFPQKADKVGKRAAAHPSAAIQS